MRNKIGAIKIKFSVIIPVYNTDIDRFKKCINSIINNKYEILEIIVIDDGSEESKSYNYRIVCNRDPRIRYLKIDNGGPSRARNIGIKIGTGSYFTFVDSDDEISPHLFYEAFEIINRESDVDLVMGLVQRNKKLSINDENSIDKYIYINDYIQRQHLINQMLGCKSNFFDALKNGYIGDGPVCRVIKREICQDVIFNENIKWAEDTLWNIELISKTFSIVIVDSLWYSYNSNMNSITNSFNRNILSEFNSVINLEVYYMNKFWPNNRLGIKNRVFNDLFLFSKMYLFNKNNTDSLISRYSAFSNILKDKNISNNLKGIVFKEHSLIKKYLKLFISYNCTNGFKFIAFAILLVLFKFTKH